MSVLQVRKVASVLHGNRPRPTHRLPVAGTGGAQTHVEMASEDNMPLDDVLDYFWRLVTLFNAFADADAFLCDSQERQGERTLMMLYEQACSYPHKALMNCLSKAPRDRSYADYATKTS